MIDQIRKTPELAPYLTSDIEDTGIVVEVDPKVVDEEFTGIKVDSYYAGLKSASTPKSVDFVVPVDCSCDVYNLYVIELKNVKDSRKIIIKEIHEKFTTTIDDFLSNRFKEIFLNDRYSYRNIHLYLIADVYHAGGRFSNHKEYFEFMKKCKGRDTLKVELNLSSKLFRFKGKTLWIQYDIPPNPIIRKDT